MLAKNAPPCPACTIIVVKVTPARKGTTRDGSHRTLCVMDCSCSAAPPGRMCSNLRELLEAVRTVPDAVLEHHMMRCALEDHFEMHEFPNDLARWCWATLGDNILGEQLALMDPYRQPSLAALRAAIINIIEDRLWGLDRVPWCRPGLELHLIQSRLIAYDTGERIFTPAALGEAIGGMSSRSLFFHVHDARWRTAGHSDDFSLWLELCGAEASLVNSLRAIDYYFLNLSQLRQALLEAFQHHAAEAPPVPRTVA